MVNTLHMQINEGATLQIELVKKAIDKPADAIVAASHPAQERKQNISKKPAPEDKLPSEKRVEMAAIAEPLPDTSHQQGNKSHQTEVEKLTYTEATNMVSSAGAMPADVQQMILTRISYPRQARRKGWQGKATFHLDVREQKLAHLDLFHSSGHNLLDRAAMRGIHAIDHLPLANGLYRLPVEFRLQ